MFSDSQAAILALDNSEITSLLVRETKYALNKLASKVQRLSIVWIKAHVGHEGNEEADRLAKLGTTNNEKHVQVGTPQAEMKSEISKYVRDIWNEEWQSYLSLIHI